MNGKLTIRDLGKTQYEQTLALQESICASRIHDQIANCILITEHFPVITLGARKSENKLTVPQEQLDQRGIHICTAGRGGGTTAHNPGQIVMYPIIKLKSIPLGIPEYVRTLEEIGIKLLERFGIAAVRKKGAPGLWTDGRKIGSIGVQVKKWVTFHGMAVNFTNDLTIFDYIVPCGLKDVKMTSVQQETGRSPSMNEVKEILKNLCLQYLSSNGDDLR